LKKILAITLILSSIILADSADNNSTSTNEKTKEKKLIEIKDESGLSNSQIRQKAKDNEKKEQSKTKTKTKTKDIVKEIIEKSNKDEVDLSKFQTPWEKMSPTPVAYDWVKTKSGEWFKGKIKILYNHKLEFDSDEIGLYTFKFKNVVEIRSYNIISVNIENIIVFAGIVRLKGDVLTVIQGDKIFKFDRSEIISLAPESEKRLDFWSGKITISMDFREGNKKQYDYSAKVSLKRRTSQSNLVLDYLGRISSRNNAETANDQRINQKYDKLLTKNFFWTPIFSEFYQDKFQNIKLQL